MEYISGMKAKTEKQLQKEIDVLRNELGEIQLAKKNKELQKNLGKFYKTKNRYSDDSDWWLYVKVLAVDDGFLKVFSFEHTSAERFEAAVCTRYNMDGYYEINADEFNEEFEHFMQKMRAAQLDINPFK